VIGFRSSTWASLAVLRLSTGVADAAALASLDVCTGNGRTADIETDRSLAARV